MKLNDVKDKIDNYFNNISGEEIIKQFEDLGYEFVPIKWYDKIIKIFNKLKQ